MIDFHSHILPDVDDGSENIEETMELLKEAKEVGFDSVISTAHYYKGEFEVNVADRKALLEKVSNELSKTEVDLKLYLGNEIYISQSILNILETQEATSINNSKYVLFELSFSEMHRYINDIIYNLLEHKYVPVLAHPERYFFVQKDPNIVYDLIQKGVLMQMNYGSILGVYGNKAKNIAKKLLQNNMVHFLGSDVHRKNTIYPKIPEALEKIEEIVGEEKLREITTVNPELVLENKVIDIDEPNKIKLSLREKIVNSF